ncbi:hypothetical protein I3843_09G047600 [Carya illinoinensis]|uniref:Uncharacterized protein n=1 Tax=Carya illinoinensis TaxID=32201 RepID=A0A922E2I0_CARIL|nr:hypothetical protein I3760_09G047100 [Carya illinoinensis]KAG6694412.1 hypothetical protein I3842_09G047300 [Carya illinoinensis]KAG7962069.1 hypothetical protein I3843_09G047600 [Carya illinoinensis]
MPRYFSIKSVMILVSATFVLLVLPLVLPPLSPPPLILLFVPVMIISVLVFLALSQPQLPNITVCTLYV